MNEQAFGVLEYEDLRALVRRGAQTEMGRARADALAPLNDVAAVRRSLAALSECVELKRRGAGWSFSELADPSDALARLRIEGAVLEPLALLELARLCDQVGEARARIQAERADAPVLWALVADLPRELYALAARTTAKILPSGELDDRASPELARIRHDINRLRSSITRALENLMHRTEEAIQDQLVTVRNERFVSPVRADHRGRVAGVAHGFSSSGATVFIEPLDTIESNNELQNLRETEEREITRILATLTDELRRELPALERAAEAVAELDFINAKAALARTFNCVSPLIDETGTLELIAARHPLLEENLRATNEQVVPVSLTLDAEHSVMVISGANAGGKTVVLKTAGLLALMALSGLHVPAQTARVPPYASVLADIGDRQSLAAHLSTFTAHIANISRMLDDCAAPALVLLDEVGTGTDPEEGSALGVAAASSRVNESARMAAEYLRRIQREAEQAEQLRRALEEERAAVAEKYSSLDRQAQHRERERQQAFERDMRALVTDFERRAQELFAQIEDRAVRLKVEREAEKRAAELRRTAQRAAAQTRQQQVVTEQPGGLRVVRREREAGASGAASDARASSTGARAASTDMRAGADADAYRPASVAREIVAGDTVRLRTFGKTGTVERVSGHEAEVRVGALRLREKLTNLELMERAPQTDTARQTQLERIAAADARTTQVRLTQAKREPDAELNPIGRTTDQAVAAV